MTNPALDSSHFLDFSQLLSFIVVVIIIIIIIVIIISKFTNLPKIGIKLSKVNKINIYPNNICGIYYYYYYYYYYYFIFFLHYVTFRFIQ